MKKLIKFLNNYINNYKLEKKYKKERKKFIENFPFINTDKEYEDIMNKNYENMSDLEKEQVAQYIGMRCSYFVTNDYWTRVSSQDIERHLRKEIDIFELQRHLSNPILDSPLNIYLGGVHFVLDKLNLMYYINKKY